MLIVEVPTVTVKCRTAIKALFLNFTLRKLVSLSFTSISFLLLNHKSVTKVGIIYFNAWHRYITSYRRNRVNDKPTRPYLWCMFDNNTKRP